MSTIAKVVSDFNPRSYERSDSIYDDGTVIRSDFNPRSYERSDSGVSNTAYIISISIHAPTRGATCYRHIGTILHRYFNPRSYERSDGLMFAKSEDEMISIHAPTRGATPSSSLMSRIMSISIHAPTRGATAKINKIIKPTC